MQKPSPMMGCARGIRLFPLVLPRNAFPFHHLTLTSKCNHYCFPLMKYYSEQRHYSSVAPRVGQPLPHSHPHLMKHGELTPGISAHEYAERRRALMQQVPVDGIVLITSNSQFMMSNDIPFPFRQRNNFLYLTGFQEPDSALALIKTSDNAFQYSLFVPPRDVTKELWNGPRSGLEGAIRYFGVDKAYRMDEVISVLQSSIRKAPVLYHDFGPTQAESLLKTLNSGAKPIDVGIMIEKMRLMKSEGEIELMRLAGRLSGEAFRDIMRHTRPGLSEHELSARLEWECRKRGARCLAYPPVVANGHRSNNLIIHYVANDELLDDGNLVLVDGGGEWYNYNADITRVWPVNGKFSEPQLEIYSRVLRAQEKLIEISGEEKMSLLKLNEIASGMLKEELIAAKIMQDNSQPLPMRTLFPHSIGHYLGMDVHDTQNISDGHELQAGMVYTIEPGIYIPNNDDMYKKHFRGIGIRIEDNVYRSETQVEVLTQAAPKDPKEIEEIMKGKSTS